MCDYSLSQVKSRPARVADKLSTRDFGTGTRTRGFCAAEDSSVAVCVLPGTELSFAENVNVVSTGLFPWRENTVGQRTGFSVRSMRTGRRRIMMRSSSLMGELFC